MVARAKIAVAVLLALAAAWPGSALGKAPTDGEPASRCAVLAARDVLKRCTEVTGRLSCPATVTFGRDESGWRVEDVFLFYSDGHRVDAVDADPDLRQLAALSTVEAIAIQGTYGASTCKVTEDGLRALLPLKHLRRLSMYRLSGGIDVKALSGLPELEDLDLSTHFIEDSDTKDLVHLRDIPNLRRLNLAGRNLTDASLDHIKPLRGLEALNLKRNRPVTDAGVAKLKGLESLRELSLDLVNTTDAGLGELEGLRNLQVLRLYAWGRITGTGLSALKGMLNLRELSIGPLEIAPKDLLALKDMTRLERLTIHGRVKGATGKLDLSFLTSLKELHVGLDAGEAELVLPVGLQRVEFSVEQTRWASYRPALARSPDLVIRTRPQEPRETLALLKALPNPLELECMFEGDGSTQTFAAAAPKTLRSLEALFVGRCTDASLKVLAGLDRLEALETTCCVLLGEFTEAGIAELGRLRNLRRLELWDLTVGGLARMGDLRELRSLAVSLKLAKEAPAPVIDGALAKWKALGKLEELSIKVGPWDRNVTLTDEGLKHLTALRSLRVLDLSGCSGFNDEALGSLMDALPELKTVRRARRPNPRSTASRPAETPKAKKPE